MRLLPCIGLNLEWFSVNIIFDNIQRLSIRPILCKLKIVLKGTSVSFYVIFHFVKVLFKRSSFIKIFVYRIISETFIWNQPLIRRNLVFIHENWSLTFTINVHGTCHCRSSEYSFVFCLNYILTCPFFRQNVKILRTG